LAVVEIAECLYEFVCATEDAVVERLLVQGGSPVSAGQALASARVTVHDPAV
jgi:hypothetical protein